MNNYAYTTLLANDEYTMGALCLHYSLLRVNSKYPLVIMVFDTVSPLTIEKLNEANASYVVIPNPFKWGKEKDFQRIVMCKYYLFDLKQYDKVCFIDADIIVLNNIDWVFNYKTPAGKYLIGDDETIDPDEDVLQIAAENFIVCPADFTSDYIFKTLGFGEFDEHVLSKLYKPREITDLRVTDWNRYIYHAHSNNGGNRLYHYWDIFHLDTPLLAYQFVVHNDSFDRLIELEIKYFEEHPEEDHWNDKKEEDN